ncbi:hypothetical protein ACI2JA_03715 [Alkalihalobacillus sp. NPDC078783]
MSNLKNNLNQRRNKINEERLEFAKHIGYIDGRNSIKAEDDDIHYFKVGGFDMGEDLTIVIKDSSIINAHKKVTRQLQSNDINFDYLECVLKSDLQ